MPDAAELKLLKGLYKEHGERLVDEITYIVHGNGQGDCYECRCWDYCNSQRSCFDAIKLVVLDYLVEDKNFVEYMNDFNCSLEEAKEALRVKEIKQ